MRKMRAKSDAVCSVESAAKEGGANLLLPLLLPGVAIVLCSVGRGVVGGRRRRIVNRYGDVYGARGGGGYSRGAGWGGGHGRWMRVAASK